MEKPTTPKIDKSPEKIVDKIESLDEIVDGDDISLVSEVSHLTSPRNEFFNFIFSGYF